MSCHGRLFLPLLALSTALGHAQRTNTPKPASRDVLTEGILQRAGLHLPQNWTLAGQSAMYASSDSLTEVKIAWDVLPGAPARIREHDVDAWKTPGSLVLKSVTAKVPGSFGRLDLLMPLTIWGVCLTAEDEVCGVTRQGDTRWEGAEHGNEGWVNTKIDLDFWLPNTPAMAKVAVYESSVENNMFSLHKVGEVRISEGGN